MAIKDNAAAIILTHYHPSGNPAPSKEDYEITERIKKDGVPIGIEVLDHGVIARKRYYSFLEDG